ncbi:MAG: Ppx/GppA family phosphatase [Rikenellaceae bacterium]
MKNNDEEVNYAAIDIGSNAARLLIKSVEGGRFKKQILLRVPLRLGFDVFSSGEVSEKKADKLKRLMKVFNNLMKIYDVADYRACATSAMRDATNGDAIIKKIEKSTDIKIEVIDGQEEARIIYNNHVSGLDEGNNSYMYVDVGGGSTEVNLLSKGELLYSKSYNIGTIRILGGSISDTIWGELESELGQVTKGLGHVNIIGSGGNINKLYRMGGANDDQCLSVDALRGLYDELRPLSIKQRREQYDLKKDRSDVIVPAAEIFLNIANTIHADHIYVPAVGLSDGIIENLYAKSLEARQ